MSEIDDVINQLTGHKAFDASQQTELDQAANQVVNLSSKLDGALADNATLSSELEAAKIRIAELEKQPPPPPPPPTPTYTGPLYGSTSKATTFDQLDTALATAVGGKRPVLMFDHMYGGSTIPTSIPPELLHSGLTFGMLNVKGNIDSPPTANLASLAQSIPPGVTLLMPVFHEPEDDGFGPTKFWSGFMKVARAVWGLPGGTFRTGASIVPMLNLHGRLFDGRGDVSWGTADSWKPPTTVTDAEKAKIIATINGYSTGQIAAYDTPAEVFEPGFKVLQSWGFSRLGVCEMGYYPRTSGQYLLDFDVVARKYKLEVVSYFHSDVGSSSPNGTWALDTSQSQKAYAQIALAGRRS